MSMTTSNFRAQIQFPSFNPSLKNPTKFPCLLPVKAASPPRFTSSAASSSSTPVKLSVSKKPSKNFDIIEAIPSENSRFLFVGAVSVGVVLFLMGCDDQKAFALGPEGPLVEEFWDNVRRYGLYALTVSTGALYTIFQPIFELLKNPISAVLVLAILGGGIFIVSQVLTAMVGVSDFSYDYGY